LRLLSEIQEQLPLALPNLSLVGLPGRFWRIAASAYGLKYLRGSRFDWRCPLSLSLGRFHSPLGYGIPVALVSGMPVFAGCLQEAATAEPFIDDPAAQPV
jgi:hypothetical protein